MSIINHTHRFVFVHVPKNAGTSVSHLLSSLSTYRDLELGVHRETRTADAFYRDRFGLGKHSPARQIRRVMGAEDFGRYTVIGVARDPVDRVCSLFHFLRRWQDWTRLERFQRFEQEFAALPDADAFVRSELFASHGPGDLFRPQTHWLCDANGASLVDVLLHYESLGQEVDALAHRLGLPEEALGALPRKNVTEGRPDAALAERSAAIVFERYAGDYEALGYEPRRSP